MSGERNRLIHEVDELREESASLRNELTELRRGINDLQRERQGALDRRQQIFQDAESQRARLLREIEQLGGQVEIMRRGIMSLLNMSSTDALETTARMNPAQSSTEQEPIPTTTLPRNIPPPTELPTSPLQVAPISSPAGVDPADPDPPKMKMICPICLISYSMIQK